ncbi:hypothetical protein NitYY0826_C0288 [Nitratiruptor sp. YY08-26]|uniref:hypothetical protein n=1 Tax=unclassified Nitratiruptor TaxID=2624044 RepID=UPI0019152BC3|nr:MULTISPECIES: hypothetical protein [unclassified Nitratiruptor]BCD61442.1 hypothetical protein NitYY0813_C0287 [Nitratiruptor sp. YY08-13]BCD65376.1 hypothetical protein NitYY0826_C0288 [Nitratiruptor sp. YY08-26]
MDKKKLLQKAAESFMKKNFQVSLQNYNSVLQLEPTNKEAHLGVILCDLASEDEEEALALFDFYIILKEEGEEEPEKRVLEMLKTLEDSQRSFVESFENENSTVAMEGITYKDFKEIVANRGSFKRAFEDIMFSTKVIITQKNDFFDFIENLIENGFTDIVYSYLEDASKLYPTDEKLQEFFEKLHSEKA